MYDCVVAAPMGAMADRPLPGGGPEERRPDSLVAKNINDLVNKSHVPDMAKQPTVRQRCKLTPLILFLRVRRHRRTPCLELTGKSLPE